MNKRTDSRLKRAGFTMIEMMVSVAVISIVIGIAVPAFMRVRIGANESAAEKALMTYRTAFINYQLDSGTFGYPASFDLLDGYVDGGLAQVAAQRNGYKFVLESSDAATYRIVATPTQPNVTGINIFILDQSGNVAFSNAIDGLIPTLAPPGEVFGTAGFFSAMLADANLSAADKTDILAGFIEYWGQYANVKYDSKLAAGLVEPKTGKNSTYLTIPSDKKEAFDQVYADAKKQLANAGIKTYKAYPEDVKVYDGKKTTYYFHSVGGYGFNPENDGSTIVQIGYEFPDPTPTSIGDINLTDAGKKSLGYKVDVELDYQCQVKGINC